MTIDEFKSISPYERMVHLIRWDQQVKSELALGKRVGFYVLKGELGSGNFSRVKAAVHTLTKGTTFHNTSSLIGFTKCNVLICCTLSY